MLPPIALVNSIEMLRDGGSLAADFQGTNGSQYWLHFKVRIRELPTGESERMGYENPVVLERASGHGTEISWQHARTLLNQMPSMLHQEADLEWWAAMYDCAANDGQLPSGVEQFFGLPRAR